MKYILVTFLAILLFSYPTFSVAEDAGYVLVDDSPTAATVQIDDVATPVTPPVAQPNAVSPAEVAPIAATIPTTPNAQQVMPASVEPVSVTPEDSAVQPEQQTQPEEQVLAEVPVGQGSLFDGVNFETLNIKFKSMFFTQEQIDYLYSSLKKGQIVPVDISDTSNTNNSGQTANNSAVVDENKIIPKNYFLGSILYPKDKNWTLWINDSKIRKEDTNGELKVVSIEETYATFAFKTSKLRNYINDFDTLPPNSSGDWTYISDDKNVKVNKLTGVVEFKLKLSQTFIMNELRIAEGKVEESDPIDLPTKDTSEVIMDKATTIKEKAADVINKAIDSKKQDIDMLSPDGKENPEPKPSDAETIPADTAKSKVDAAVSKMQSPANMLYTPPANMPAAGAVGQ